MGSASGFLRAPISYEVVRSRFIRLQDFGLAAINEMLFDMQQQAESVVRMAVPDGELLTTRTADMRYAGQGHEISVSLPLPKLTLSAATLLKENFDDSYARQYGQIIPGIDIEVLSWTVTVTHTTGI